jgi:hypothetical protein
MISSSTPCAQLPRVNRHQNRSENEVEDITLSEKIRITRKQYEVLKIVCDTYHKSISEYMQEALVEVMRTDIEEGNFCEALLDKLGGENQQEEKRANTSPAAFFNDDSSDLQF